MIEHISQLSDADLRELLAALQSGRISSPFSKLQIDRVLSHSLAGIVAESLGSFVDLGFSDEQIATIIEIVLRDRTVSQKKETPIDLVTSGPEAEGITNRDTSVVVRELFTHAEKSVLVVGYAVYQGQQVFEALAKRMQDKPELKVKMFLDIARQNRDTTTSNILVSRFTQRFREKQWPQGCRLPEIYYDPRSVDDDHRVRSSLHAKCVVVDEERVFVSSANFTAAGQERNIEVGLNIESASLAQRLIRHFELLREHGLVERAV